jgi:hypothetical protein
MRISKKAQYLLELMCRLLRYDPPNSFYKFPISSTTQAIRKIFRVLQGCRAISRYLVSVLYVVLIYCFYL